MQVTNKLHLPAAFVKTVSVERHNKAGCYSATTLNKGTKEIILQERHWDEFETDAADNVWAVWGTAVHSLFESVPDDNFHEEKFDVAVGNSRVTGVVDSYDMERGIINDWKTASVYKVMKGDFADWHRQGMTYAWLLKRNGLDVRRCRFIALLKDHSKSKAKFDPAYPQSPVFVCEFDVTPEDLEAAGDRIGAKVAEIEAAEKMGDDDIEPCTAEERWADADKWAVMKNGRKTAVRVFDSEADAEAFAGELGNSHYVEHRPAVSRKCADYCLCKDFCSFYKQMQGGEK
ncbi:MAG: PD-(D/E)XK nuclease family protein [Lachnospiraceae bacterium]|nr:PD-(D/E)XK nuclease family protein [Lachnospiraceae bacterium]